MLGLMTIGSLRFVGSSHRDIPDISIEWLKQLIEIDVAC